MIRSLFKYVLSNLSNLKAKFLSFNGRHGVYDQEAHDREEFESKFRADLNKCRGKNPSVIKRSQWEMYHNKRGDIYVYFLKSKRRVIYRR